MDDTGSHNAPNSVSLLFIGFLPGTINCYREQQGRREGTGWWRELWKNKRENTALWEDVLRIQWSEKIMKERSYGMLPLPLLAVSLFIQLSASSPPSLRPSTMTELSLSMLFFQAHYFKINSTASITSGDMSCSFNIPNRQNHIFPLSIKHRGNCLGSGCFIAVLHYENRLSNIFWKRCLW